MAEERNGNEIDPQCAFHLGIKAEFVCRNDECKEELVCKKCTLIRHKGHEISKLDEMMGIYKRRITVFYKNAREKKLVPLEKTSVKVAADLSNYDDSTGALSHDIENRKQQLCRMLEQQCNESKKHFHQMRTSKRKEMEQYQHDILTKIEEIEEDMSSLKDCVNGTCKADIIRAVKTMISKTYHIKDYPNDLFRPDEKPLEDMESNLEGKIKLVRYDFVSSFVMNRIYQSTYWIYKKLKLL